MTSFQPNVGDVILNKYECISLVGEGAFGCVYRARDIKLGRIVAIKFINAANGVLKRFGDELDAIKNLDHPNIVRLYDYDILKGGIPCLVMEFVNGRELGEILSQEGPFDLPRIGDIALQVLDALVETHNHEIIHCDLKPENIMLTSVGARTNVVKLIDFGVAALLEKTTSNNERQKLLIGTPQYMAPEQIRHEQLGPWTDNYALGLILIELFSGRFVFDHEDAREILKMQLFQPAILPHELAISELGPIISRAVEKDISKRYQNTREFYNDVSNAIQAIQISERSKPINKARLNSVNSVFDDLDDLKSFKPTNLTLQSGLHRLPTQMKLIELDENDLKRPSGAANEVATFPTNHRADSHNNPPGLSGLSVSDERISLKSRRERLSQSILKPADKYISEPEFGRPLIPEIPKHTNSVRMEPPPSLDVPSIPQIEGIDAHAEPPKAASAASQADLASDLDLASGLDLSSLQSSLENMGERSPDSDPAAPVPTLDGNVPTIRPKVPTLGPVVPKLSNGLKSANKLKATTDDIVETPAPKKKTIHQEPAEKGKAPAHHKNRAHLIIIVLSLLLLIGGGGAYYAWNTGLLESFGVVKPKPQETTNYPAAQTPEPENDTAGVVRFSTIRNTAQKMAYTAAISGTLGHSQTLKKMTHYRVVGSPTDAAVYLNERRVCGKTPCDVHFFGETDKTQLGIRKGSKTKAVDLAQQNPADPIILVLGK
ncbi:MAG: serine/threonine protein kinase [Proteobacteria bacterium]|nr:serine/threonine protein kinase [Pseudomonadota bacterium]